MKLLDLLVKELPHRGGWPKGVDAVEQDCEGELFEKDSDYCSGFKLEKCDDWITDVVTKQQYESALAASQKPAWNGEGIPPAGCECEFISNDTSWGVVRVIGMDDDKVVIKPSGEIYYGITPSNRQVFRPLRSESERKRDKAVEAIDFYMPESIPDTPNEFYYAKKIYDAIAAGKIPGVKLDD